MKDIELGNVIAERILFWEGSPADKLVVKIGSPMPFAPGNDSTLFYCPYPIETLDGRLALELRGGMDSMQALQKALEVIKERLMECQNEFGKKLCWGDPKNVMTGF